MGLLAIRTLTRALRQAVSDLCYEASNAIRNGAELIILSDVPRNSAPWFTGVRVSRNNYAL